jgi:hypothetical protein
MQTVWIRSKSSTVNFGFRWWLIFMWWKQCNIYNVCRNIVSVTVSTEIM